MDRKQFLEEFFDGTPAELWYTSSKKKLSSGAREMLTDEFGTRALRVVKVYDGQFLGPQKPRKQKPRWMGLANLVGLGDYALRVRNAEGIVETVQKKWYTDNNQPVETGEKEKKGVFKKREVPVMKAPYDNVTPVALTLYAATNGRSNADLMKVNFAKGFAIGPAAKKELAEKAGLEYYTISQA